MGRWVTRQIRTVLIFTAYIYCLTFLMPRVTSFLVHNFTVLDFRLATVVIATISSESATTRNINLYFPLNYSET